MQQVTVLWGDVDDGMAPRLHHTETVGDLSEHRTRLGLLYEAMLAELDQEMFELAAEQMTTYVIAILPGHVEPLFLWDGNLAD